MLGTSSCEVMKNGGVTAANRSRSSAPDDWNETAGIAQVLRQLVVKLEHCHHAWIVDAALGGGTSYQLAKDPLPR
jgi:hypothetical protein